MNEHTVVVSRVFPVTPDLLWRALTEKEQMKEWYFDLTEFRPEAGFHFTFSGGPSEDRQYLHLCTVTDAVPEKLLAYSWEYKGYPGRTIVSFTLSPVSDGTRLTLSHQGLDTFPSDNPDFARENFSEGWNDIINRSLKEYIEKLTNNSPAHNF